MVILWTFISIISVMRLHNNVVSLVYGHMEKQEMEVEWKLETENGNGNWKWKCANRWRSKFKVHDILKLAHQGAVRLQQCMYRQEYVHTNHTHSYCHVKTQPHYYR